MKDALIYIHGKGGNARECEHYVPLFKDRDVIGFDYRSQTPWEAKEEFPRFFDLVAQTHGSVAVAANSIGAFFTLHALADRKIERAYLISPVADMTRLILDMMQWANVTEEMLCRQKEIRTDFGETLSWEYLCYVRAHPIVWRTPTSILYGGKDALVSAASVREFADRTGAALTVMENGEHWFHTPEQMRFLDAWIERESSKEC
ncbi:MAG: alpha/beta hydrolase [Clostridia bacterium]|nr:alpha/beta hydrolase [Clostridia bacterium]